jgi:hypothetical protein
MKTFRHSGKLGDLVYALPTVRAMGGGTLYVHPGGGQGIGERDACAIVPLLAVQDYISHADLWRGEPIDVDLDVWRSHFRPFSHSLAESHLLAFGLPLDEVNARWLHVNRPQAPSGRVLFGRTGIRVGAPGFWGTCYELFREKAVFVGHPNEHQCFCEQVGQIERLETANLLELACVIEDSALFVGNQSCAYAIAEGLKHRAILGGDAGAPDCLFHRPDALMVMTEEDLSDIEPFAREMGAL